MKFFESSSIKAVIVLSGAIVVALGCFRFGESVGYHKALYASKAADNYYRVFSPGISSTIPSDDFSDSHGAAGRILAVAPPILVVADNDNTEKTIHILPNTLIRKYRGSANADELSIGENVIVLGDPDGAGAIEASLIRIIPSESASQ